jgi:N6-adenosine-specific RNA methylase IME4
LSERQRLQNRRPSVPAFHPLADIFPLIEGDEFTALVEDIRANGLREPVILHEGKILDGRNRLRACEAAGVACRFEQYAGDDPIGYVVSLNLRRRHLNESQRAMVAAKLANLAVGSNQHVVRVTHDNATGEKFDPPFASASANLRRPNAEAASRLLNIGTRSIETARTVIREGVPELQHAVERGVVSVSAAADVATLAAGEQAEVVARGRREILRKAQEIRAEMTEERRAQRIAKAVELSARSGPLPHDRKYPLLYADPPWRYDFSMTSTRAIEANYPTLELEQICALPVSDLAAPTAILFLWVPPPILEKGFTVIRAWGFQYCTGAVWRKDKIGAGFYFRQQHEHLLVASRGDMPAPPPPSRPPSVLDAPRREHSRKPDEAYELIERMYPELAKIELFARGTREGWAAWGNEAPPAMEAAQ